MGNHEDGRKGDDWVTGIGYDYIIVGSGIVGLYAALLAREHGLMAVR